MRPLQSQDLRAAREQSIRMAIERRLDQQVPGASDDATGVARLLETTGDHDERVRTQVSMSRQVESGRECLATWSDRPESVVKVADALSVDVRHSLSSGSNPFDPSLTPRRREKGIRSILFKTRGRFKH
jgi:hypothetical protein